MKNLPIMLIVLLAPLCSADSSEYIYGCSDLSLTGSTYYLMQDIVNSESIKCMNVTAQWVTLDCQGHLIDGVDAQDSVGIYLMQSPGVNTNSNFRNCRINDWDYGAAIFYAQNTSFVNLTISSSKQYGVFSYKGGENVYRNVSVSGSGNRGFVLWNTSRNLVEGCDSSSNAVDGFILDSENAHNNTIRHTTASNNAEKGFYLYLCNDNTVHNVTSTNNSVGFFSYASEGNNISHSKSMRNNVAGIVVVNSGSIKRNWIYDNLFNNTVDYRALENTYPNNWNISQGSGINVLGGEALGGNYWATPQGDGYSEEECDADGDGFCDVTLMLSSDDYDYLPLSPNAFGCILEGNYAPCSEVSILEVIGLLDRWNTGEASLEEALSLIDAWMD